MFGVPFFITFRTHSTISCGMIQFGSWLAYTSGGIGELGKAGVRPNKRLQLPLRASRLPPLPRGCGGSSRVAVVVLAASGPSHPRVPQGAAEAQSR